MSKKRFDKKILLNVDYATYEMVMAMAEKEKKPDEKYPNINRFIRNLISKVIHS